MDWYLGEVQSVLSVVLIALMCVIGLQNVITFSLVIQMIFHRSSEYFQSEFYS